MPCQQGELQAPRGGFSRRSSVLRGWLKGDKAGMVGGQGWPRQGAEPSH